MGKRGFMRGSANLPLDIYWGGNLHEGMVTNFSGSGMYIESEICPARGSNIEIVLIVGDEVFKLFGQVKRTVGANGTSGGIGVELLNPSISYRRFICIVYDYAYNGPCLKPVKPSLEVSMRIHEKVVS